MDEENPRWADVAHEILTKKKVNLSVSIPLYLYQKVEEESRKTLKRKSEIITEALKKYFGGE